ncbi:MFS transporter [Streptomyces sp. 8ZJF_21]|uniref:MFS transporter n=1 Tax=Streptomyces sp. 8ZJF_21 TaxID=2903141 RepID=UPI001E3F38D2|nr:MFS transporter [Streptomyces sp. 8ZJF_21]MCD9593476.1 MFS transporter [Streptomyces sp. 8ZJF_21]
MDSDDRGDRSRRGNSGDRNSGDRRPLLLVLAANTVSIAGNSLTLIAVPWFVLETTGSAAKAGLVSFCATLPVVVSAVIGGPVIDRIGRRRVSIASDSLCGVAVAAIPVLHFAGLLRFWQLCALMAFSGLLHAPGETARQVLVPALAERAGTTLSRAASFYDGASRGARMMGAALGGLLIALLGPPAVLLLDAATFAASALLIMAGLRGLPAAAPRKPLVPVSARAYRAELAEGYRFLLRHRLLLAIVLMVMVTNGLDQGLSSVLLPVHAERHLGGSVELGLLTALFGGGALVGALLYGAVGDRFPRRTVFAVSFLVCGMPRFLVAAFVPGVSPLAVTMAASGVAAGMLNPILTTVTYEAVPDELRSRVSGALTAGVWVVMPLGGLAAGCLVEGVGLTAAFLVTGGVYFLATLSPLVFPAWRGMDVGAAADEGAAADKGTATGREAAVNKEAAVSLSSAGRLRPTAASAEPSRHP